MGLILYATYRHADDLQNSKLVMIGVHSFVSSYYIVIQEIS
jgi:hypothetical protein